MIPGAVRRGYGFVRKLVVAVVGGTVLLLGVALLVLPGPAFIVIPIGLGILAVEFAWARRLLARAKEGGQRTLERLRRVPRAADDGPATPPEKP